MKQNRNADHPFLFGTASKNIYSQAANSCTSQRDADIETEVLCVYRSFQKRADCPSSFLDVFPLEGRHGSHAEEKNQFRMPLSMVQYCLEDAAPKFFAVLGRIKDIRCELDLCGATSRPE